MLTVGTGTRNGVWTLDAFNVEEQREFPLFTYRKYVSCDQQLHISSYFIGIFFSGFMSCETKGPLGSLGTMSFFDKKMKKFFQQSLVLVGLDVGYSVARIVIVIYFNTGNIHKKKNSTVPGKKNIPLNNPRSVFSVLRDLVLSRTALLLE